MEQAVKVRYEGEGAFSPVSRFWAGRADKQYVVGEIYDMAPWLDRSQATHNHEFAVIGEMFNSLPERFKDEPWAQSPEHLRKYALIRTRWCDTQTYPCASHAEAMRWAANLRPRDEYSIVKAEGPLVYVFTAVSQSRRAMGKDRFQKSKTDIIEFIEDLIGVERGASAGAEAA
jgi:hypothetical protein